MNAQLRETVVITGATAGVGRATARAFARRGARIALLARGKERLEAARREVEDLGGEALAFPIDVSSSEQVDHAAAEVEKAFGPIDIWINDAMVTVFSPVMDMTPQEFERVTQVTYLGTVYGTMAALKRMVPRNHGTIVQVSSAMAFRGIPLQAAYCGAKHGIKGFTESVRTELIHDRSRVHVTMVHLPGMNTPQFEWARSKLAHYPQPVPPIYQPEIAANTVVWAAHHRRREVFVTGTTLKVVWGNRAAPGILDHYLGRIGYKSQQTGGSAMHRSDNLYTPAPGDPGAHGPYDQRATRFSLQLQATKNRRWLILAGIAGAAGILAGTQALNRDSASRKMLARLTEREPPSRRSLLDSLSERTAEARSLLAGLSDRTEEARSLLGRARGRRPAGRLRSLTRRSLQWMR